jgi:hypothetical protein
MRGTSAPVATFAALLVFASAPGHAQPDTTPPPVPQREGTPVHPGPPPPPPADDNDEPEAQAPPDALPPAAAPDLAAFQRGLGPYGRWRNLPEYGLVWVPAGVPAEWQPYSDGHWAATDWGWSFVSTVPWGWAVFHYGRWGFDPVLGWFWVPGFVWAPAWVFWRYQAGYVCWAPFAPGGYHFGRHWHGWVVVPARHFLHPLQGHVVPRRFVGPIVRTTTPARSIGRGPVRGFFGPPRARVAPIPRSAPGK